MNLTIGTLLNGRLQYRQMATGHRSGIEPVMLAAAIPAAPGATVLEAGTGAGAALLCLSHRVAAITGIGIERDPALAALAAANFHANAMTNLTALAADVTTLPLNRRFDHCFANPPWHPRTATRSPDPARERAHHAPPDLLADWTTALAMLLKPGGTLTFIIPAAQLDTCIIAMRAADCASCHILPLWPRAGRPAKLVIIQSRKGRVGGVTLRPGLVLHGPEGYTKAADAILRDGAALGA